MLRKTAFCEGVLNAAQSVGILDLRFARAGAGAGVLDDVCSADAGHADHTSLLAANGTRTAQPAEPFRLSARPVIRQPG